MMRDWRTGAARIFFGASLVASMAAVSATAPAQQITHAVPAVRACLCARQAVDAEEGKMNAERQRYEESKQRAESLNRTVAEARPKVDIENRNAIEAFAALLRRRDAAAEAFRQESLRYAEAVNLFNQAVNQNNAACVGRLFDTKEIEAMKENLVCPRE